MTGSRGGIVINIYSPEPERRTYLPHYQAPKSLISQVAVPRTIFDRNESPFEKYICRVRTAHQPLKAPEGIKRADSECDRDLEGV